MELFAVPGGGTLPIWWWGGAAWKKYRGVRELLFIPKKGGLENWNKHRPKAVVGEGVGGGVPLVQGGSGGPQPDILCYLDALWCNLRHFEPKYKSSK